MMMSSGRGHRNHPDLYLSAATPWNVPHKIHSPLDHVSVDSLRATRPSFLGPPLTHPAALISEQGGITSPLPPSSIPHVPQEKLVIGLLVTPDSENQVMALGVWNPFILFAEQDLLVFKYATQAPGISELFTYDDVFQSTGSHLLHGILGEQSKGPKESLGNCWWCSWGFLSFFFN